MNRRKVLTAGIAALLGSKALRSHTLGAQNPNHDPCDNFFAYEQAEAALSGTYGQNVCPNLPTLESVTPPGLDGAIVDEYFGGSGKNGIRFNSGRSVTMAGLLDWGSRLRDYPEGWCQDLSGNVGGPARGHLAQRSPVFITSSDGTPVSYDDNQIDDALCWVWDGESDPVNLNLWFIEQGSAVWNPDTTPDDIRQDFEKADRQARSNNIGMWGSCPDVDQREPVLQTYYPSNMRPGLIARASGDWGGASNFEIETPGMYQVTAIAPDANSYLEIVVLRNLDTGQEYPEFYWTIFGPQTFSIPVWMDAGTYLLDCQAVGGWFFYVQTIPE